MSSCLSSSLPSIQRTTSLQLMSASRPSASQPSLAPPFHRHVSTPVHPPPLLHSASTVAAAPGSAADWRVQVTVEDRIAQRRQLSASYQRHCPDYQALLNTAVAVEEELVFAASEGRLEYFKSGLDWEGRLRVKKRQLHDGAPRGADLDGAHPPQHSDAMDGATVTTTDDAEDADEQRSVEENRGRASRDEEVGERHAPPLAAMRKKQRK